jgi:hypothetical protein
VNTVAERLAAIARIAAAHRSGTSIHPDDADFLVFGLEGHLAGVDDPFGLRPKPGQRSVATRSAYDRRDDLVRADAQKFYPTASQADAARELHTALKRYAAAGWKRDRKLPDCPASAKTLGAILWAILRARDDVPAARTIRRLLATSSAYSWPADSAEVDSNAPRRWTT